MDFAFSPKAEALRTELLDFMDTHVYPAEAVYHQQIVESGDPHLHPPVMEELKPEARKRGLWNLFLPHKTKWTEGLSNLDYAPLAEIMGRSHIASQACNCSAPDTGNMELLTMFGTPEQQEEWLYPLLEGEIRSAFAMTEPAVASSRCHQHRVPHRARRRRVRDQRPQVVDLGRGRRALQALHPHGQDRPGRRTATCSSR